jgi:hypothetical protein
MHAYGLCAFGPSTTPDERSSYAFVVLTGLYRTRAPGTWAPMFARLLGELEDKHPGTWAPRLVGEALLGGMGR